MEHHPECNALCCGESHYMNQSDLVEQACEVMHDAYEDAASKYEWETQLASRKAWAHVPERNKATMREAVKVLLTWAEGKRTEPLLGLATTKQLLDEIAARIEVDGSNGGGGLGYRTVDS